MRKIDIVIGANYGDEGKGLATNYFCNKNEKTIVVLHNGGFQRGHTVIDGNNRHVFHALSSGTFKNADTYYADTFILNPVFFKEEYEKIKNLGYNFTVYANPQCRLTTPYDMMINTIVESFRGDKKHGSCGFGIFETTERNKSISITLNDVKDNFDYLISCLYKIREEYIFNRLETYGIKNLPISQIKMILDNNIINKYLEDLAFMLNHITIQETQFISNYEHVVFEGSQGLLLDQDANTNPNHLTPSNTDLTNPSRIIKNLKLLGFLTSPKISVHYITRTYLTRHGAGEFPSECNISEINKDLFDKTNIFNPHQGFIRYGKINIEELVERVTLDAKKIPDADFDIFVTHLNETKDYFVTANGNVKVTKISKVKYVSKEELEVETL